MSASRMADQSRWNGNAGSLRMQPRHHVLVDAAAVEPGMRVLDVATGRGETAVLAARAGAHVHATDVGASLVDAARRNAMLAGTPITASVADMRSLDGVVGGFDRVLGCAALHHLDEADARTAVAAAVRLLSPGGRALFFEPVENVPWFDFVKHCIPGPNGRPSILRRARWREWLLARDDRWMSDRELLALWPQSRIVRRFGLLRRIISGGAIDRVDAWLLQRPWLAKFGQAVVVEYRR